LKGIKKEEVMTRQRTMFRVLSMVVASVFFCTNCVWADSLAVQSRLAEVLAKARIIYAGTAIHLPWLVKGLRT